MQQNQMVNSIATALLACLLFTGPAAAAQDSFTGKVVSVTDGDTIKVLRDKKQIRVRLHGIDCPERKQAFGEMAKEFAARLVAGKTVKVIVTDTDRYGRTVGKVVLEDGKVLNHELVRAGLAWWYRRYAPKDKKLEALEAAARESKVGLWSDPDPVPPWEFRRGKRSNGESSK